MIMANALLQVMRLNISKAHRPSGDSALVRLLSIIPHEPGVRLIKRHAQKLKAAAVKVSRRNTGSLARRGPSAKTRTICARVIKPKTVPVVIRYAFIRNRRNAEE